MTEGLPLRLLENRVLVIVGGTAGLGLSAAQACVEAGASVVVVGRDPMRAATAVDLLGDRGASVTGDASLPNTAALAIRKAVETFGDFHGLYHVAGGSGRRHGDGPLHTVTDEGWDHTLRLNQSSLFYSNRAAVQALLQRGVGGSILNMSSVLGISPSPRYFSTFAYAAAKAAVIGMTKSAASYYAAQRIRFNALAPGLVQTGMSERAQQDSSIMQFIRIKQPLDGGRIGSAKDLDAAAVYFLSDASSFVTGQVLCVDGGWSVSEGQYAADPPD